MSGILQQEEQLKKKKSLHQLRTMKKEYDFSKSVRGKFYRKGTELRIPVYVNTRTHKNLERLAVKKGKAVEQIVNQLIRKEMKGIR